MRRDPRGTIIQRIKLAYRVLRAIYPEPGPIGARRRFDWARRISDFTSTRRLLPSEIVDEARRVREFGWRPDEDEANRRAFLARLQARARRCPGNSIREEQQRARLRAEIADWIRWGPPRAKAARVPKLPRVKAPPKPRVARKRKPAPRARGWTEAAIARRMLEP